MNIELNSVAEKIVAITGNYYPDDIFSDVLKVNYSITGGSGDYDVTVADEDSSNPDTSIVENVVGSFTVQLTGRKRDYDSGMTTVLGTVSLLVEDNGNGDSDTIDVDFKFTVDNQGTYQESLPLRAEYTNLNLATSYSRSSDITELSRKTTLVLNSSGGSGDTRVLWNANDFQHPNINVLTDDALVQKIISLEFHLDVADIPSSIIENQSANDYVLSGEFGFTLIDNQTDEFINDSIDWAYKVTVLAQTEETDFRETSRVVPGRFRVRNPEDNRWYDMCYDEMYMYDETYSRWHRLFPGKVFVRDANNLDWVAITCVNDPDYDDPCSSLSGDDCEGKFNDPFAGSGDGKGSGGPEFDLLQGYPQGYDLPDSFLGGFGVKTAGASYDSRFLQTGFILQRPGLLMQESYDPTGINQDDDRLGSWLNPNVLGASTWSRGAAVTEMVYDLGEDDGWFELQYAAYDSISIDVYYLGERIATTCGQVPSSTRGPLSFYIALGASGGHSKILVRVRGTERCEWALRIAGPTQTQVFPDYDPFNSDMYGDINSSVFNEPDLIRMHYLGTPALPAPCRATVGNTDIARSDVFPLHDRMQGKNFFEFYHYVGDRQGVLHLDYTSWQNADKIEVYHAGKRIASNYEPKQIAGSIAFVYDPTGSSINEIVVRVYTRTLEEGDALKTWYYSIYCVDEPGYRDLPWDCVPEDNAASTNNETRENLIASMGNYCMEDNINIDNGLNQGIFKVRFKDTSSKCLVTIYNEDGTIIPSFDPNTNQLVPTREVEGFAELDYFNFDEDTAQTYKRIAVRVQSELASTWEYEVTCPVPLLDIILDPIDVAAGISIEDSYVLAGSTEGSTWVVAEAPVNNDVVVEYTMVDGTATNLNDYCAETGSVTIPAGSDRVELPFSLAPCDDMPTPPSGAKWLTRPFSAVTDIVTNVTDNATAGIQVGAALVKTHNTAGVSFAGIKNHHHPNDEMTFSTTPADTNIDQVISGNNRYAYAQVTPEGLKDWRVTRVSGADLTISNDGWSTRNTIASIGVLQDATDNRRESEVKVELRFNDGTILSQNIRLTAQVPSSSSGSGGGGGGKGCPSFNTPIMLVDKSIKLAGNLQLGDEVLSVRYGGDSLDWHSTEADLRFTKARVENINVFEENEYVLVNDHEFTVEHPFFTNRKGVWQWVEAGELVSSDLILNSKFEVVPISVLTKMRGTLKFVRIDVSDPDTFFAGDMLAHNKEAKDAF